jgi:UDP-N-acetylmuramoyl-L-alanyl-D-glutamate--2,6-diaminopimelate ligase
MSEIAARFHGRPSRRLSLVGVTGTNGKTTTTYVLESIWRAAGRVPGVIGTINYRVGDREWPAALTTPQPVDLQGLLADMAGAGATDVAMEVSSHALALDRVRDCDFDGAVFTNLTRDHLDFHDDMESYFEAKARLFTEVLPSSTKPEPFAVIHRDDPFGARLVERARTRVVTFGRGDDADVAPIGVGSSITGLRGGIRVGRERLDIDSPLVGDAHLQNLLAATATAVAQSIAPEAIREGIARCRAIPGRMERVDGGAPFAVLVDYAHTPDALERALAALRELTAGRLVVVFGCGGDRDRGKRPIMGEAAARLADLVVLTSDNPRTEDAAAILRAIEQGVRQGGLEPIDAAAASDAERGYVVVADRKRAIRLAIDLARPDDVVLIAGKGHEPYQILGTEKRPFDDRVEARRSLEEVLPA